MAKNLLGPGFDAASFWQAKPAPNFWLACRQKHLTNLLNIAIDHDDENAAIVVGECATFYTGK
jgi:hypothetical protein